MDPAPYYNQREDFLVSVIDSVTTAWRLTRLQFLSILLGTGVSLLVTASLAALLELAKALAEKQASHDSSNESSATNAVESPKGSSPVALRWQVSHEDCNRVDRDSNESQAMNAVRRRDTETRIESSKGPSPVELTR